MADLDFSWMTANKYHYMPHWAGQLLLSIGCVPCVNPGSSFSLPSSLHITGCCKPCDLHTPPGFRVQLVFFTYICVTWYYTCLMHFLEPKIACLSMDSVAWHSQGLPEILSGTPISPFITRYTPPFDEFEVDHICIPVGSSAELQSVGPSILLVFDGLGAVIEGGPNKIVGMKKGDTFFIPAGEKFEISATVEVDLASAEQRPLQLYRAGVNHRVYH